MGATYRSDSSQEPAQQARAEALLPATRQRLTEAFEGEEALAYRRPALVDHPVRWLLLGVFGAVLPELSFLRSFGRLGQPLFATPLPDRGLLLVGCVWGLACGALAVRSLVLRRGELPSGLFLLATSLIESREGRLREWPTSRVRSIRQRGRLATLDLGPDGRIELTSGEHDLGDLLHQLREQHHDAQLTGATSTLVALDPCHAERARGSFTPIVGPAPLPGAEGSRSRLRWAASALLVMAMGVGLSWQVMRLSDRLGIERARRAGDSDSLQAYVQLDQPLAAQADEAWFELAQSQDEARLVEYMHAPLVRHSTEADSVLASRVDRRTMSAGTTASSTASRDLDRTEAIADLARYLDVGLPTQPLRAKLEERKLALGLDEALGSGCDRAIEGVLSRLGPPEALGPRVSEAHWRGFLDRARRCQSLADLWHVQAMATTPARQAGFAAAWAEFFREAQVRSEATARAAPKPRNPALPGPILAQLD